MGSGIFLPSDPEFPLFSSAMAAGMGSREGKNDGKHVMLEKSA